VGDRITMEGIELFDLLRYDGENLYIIQVKDGLGASTRDACSQLRNSSRLIEESVKTSECAKLREYHSRLSISGTAYAQTEKFKAQMRAVGTADDFVNLFKSKKRVYVLAFRYGNRVEDAVGTGSNIAKFEILGLKDHIKMTDAQFRLFQIKDS
jgi:hypothetical protein